MRRLLAILLLFLSTSALATKLPKLSAEEIEDRNAEAMHSSLKSGEKLPDTIRIRSHMVDRQGRTLWISVWQWKAPDRWYRQIQWLGTVISGGFTGESAFDGHVAWRRPEGGQPHLFDDKDRIASREVGALDRQQHWRAFLRNVANDGTDRLGNADVYRVRETHLDGRESTAYFDATTFFRLREDWIGFGGGGVRYFTDYFLDYRRGHGLTFAFHLHRISHTGSPLSSFVDEEDLFVDEIKLNEPIDDSLFAPPPGLVPATSTQPPSQ